MTAKLKAAVVGVGYLGRFHAQKYKLIEDVDLVCVSDARADRGAEVAKELGVEFEPDYKKLVGRVQMATVAASTMSHYDISKYLLSHGISVFVEKPMTVTSSEARELCDLARKNELTLQVGHVERFNPAMTAARKVLKKPLFIEVHRLAPFTPRGADVDVVLDLMIHDLDVIASLVNSQVKTVSAVGVPVLTKLVDIANARLEFESGTIVNVTASRVSLQTTRKFRVFEQDKYLSLDFGKGTVDLLTKTGEWTSGGIPPLNHESWSLEKGDALLLETRSFVECVRDKKRPLVSGEDGMNALLLAEKISEKFVSEVKPRSSAILIVAAEASSELYATRIIDECRRRELPVKFFGIGSRAMEKAGCEIIEYSEKMAVVGLWEVLAHWKVISRAFKDLLKRAVTEKPVMALLLDYPDFNLRLARKINALKIPVFYYISPQVWAWRTGRIKLIKKIICKMLVVFPFEVDFYKSHGVDVGFVGHPLLDEVLAQELSAEARLEKRGQMGIKPGDFFLGLLPGSRESELKNNFIAQLRAAEITSVKFPQAKFAVLVAPSLDIEFVKSFIPADLKLNYSVIKAEPLQMMQLFDACIVASGTATLMTALAETPMVIMYKMKTLTALIARHLVKGSFFGMPNLISKKQLVPELFQNDASPMKIAAEISKYIEDKNYYSDVKKNLSFIKEMLGTKGANNRVVDEIEAVVKA